MSCEPQDISLKQCTKCQQWKPATREYFHADKYQPDGLTYQCKVCRIPPKVIHLPKDTAPEGYKTCSDCSQIFPATTEFFHRAKDTYDKLRARCKKCQKEHDRIRYEQAKEQPSKQAPPSYLFCPGCEPTKPIDLFHKNPTGKYRLSTYCKVCVQKRTEEYCNSPHGQTVQKAYAERYYAKNREQYLERHKRWYQANREYVLEKDRQFRKDHPEILSERWQRWARTENGQERCRIRVRNRRARRKGAIGNYTYADIQRQWDVQYGKCFYCSCELISYHIDHVIPLSRGGTNWPDNLVLACPTCNLRKGTKLLYEKV